jgi:hypothetical protein
MQGQPDPGMAIDEALDDGRQGVTRLRMRRCDDQAAGVATGVLLADAPDVLRVAQHAFGNRDHRPPRLGDRQQALAAALENDDSEFVLEQLDLLGNPGLRGMQRFRRLGNVEATARDFDEIAELLELHGGCTVRLVIRI